MALNLAKLIPFRKSVRPPLPASFPTFVDNELDRVSVVTQNLVQAVKDLDARLTAGGF